jgi:hypothetical protein
MSSNLVADAFLDFDEEDGGIACGKKLKFEDGGSEVVECSFRFFQVALVLDDDHTVGVKAVVSDGEGDLKCFLMGKISIDFGEVIFIEEEGGLESFEIAVNAGIFGEIEESGGFVVEAVEQSKFFFCAEKGGKGLDYSAFFMDFSGYFIGGII